MFDGMRIRKKKKWFSATNFLECRTSQDCRFFSCTQTGLGAESTKEPNFIAIHSYKAKDLQHIS